MTTTTTTTTTTPTRIGRKLCFASLAVGLAFSLSLAGASQGYAYPTTVNLGAVEGFAILGHTTVNNTGPSLISGVLEVIPGSSATGLPPGQMLTGNMHIGDGPAGDAKAAATAAYLDAAGRLPTRRLRMDT